MNSIIRGLLLSGRPYVGPGDIVPGATAAYLLRAYSRAVALTGTQKCVRVRRSSDNAEQDIYILPNGNLDVASALAFANGSNLFVVIWYDQLGTNNAVQATAANQPQLVILSGVPYLLFNGTSHYLATGAMISFSASGGFSLFAFANATGNQSGTRKSVVDTIANTNDFEALAGLPFTNNNKWSIEAGKAGIASQQVSDNSTQTPGNWYSTSGAFASGSAGLYVNGNFITTLTYNGTINGATAANRGVSIGAEVFNSSPQLYFPGKIGEVAVYPSVLSAANELALFNNGYQYGFR